MCIYKNLVSCAIYTVELVSVKVGFMVKVPVVMWHQYLLFCLTHGGQIKSNQISLLFMVVYLFIKFYILSLNHI